jgi:hypothetical protein
MVKIGEWIYHKQYGWTQITGIDGVLLRIYGEPLSYPKGHEVHFWKDDIIEVDHEI